MDVVWLASYPKSGNTWIRFLFTNLIHGPFENSQTIFDVTPVLERGVDPASLRSDRANFIKTHYMCAPGLPFMDRAKAAIYIVRNPFDVMMSNLNYLFLTSGIGAAKNQDQIDEIGAQYVSAFLENGGDPRWREAHYGNWREHVSSWTENTLDLPVIAIRYEDLLADTVATLRRVCAFVEFDVEPETLEAAVQASSFERMREMEERELRDEIPGMFFVPGRKTGGGYRFMNRGKSGGSAEALDPRVIERHRGVFAPLIDEYGYA